MTIKEHIIDAKGEALGRVASRAAVLLRGKDTPDFKPNLAPNVKVKIVNAAALKITEKKKEGKIYWHYTGYPGGGRSEKLGNRLVRRGYGEVIKEAVKGMLPANRLRPELLKKLIIED